MRTTIAFRADASTVIGTGHVMRCLALAESLRDLGARCIFICRKHEGHRIELIRQHGHQVIALSPIQTRRPTQEKDIYADWLGVDWEIDAHETKQALSEQQIDWLIIDHYSLDRKWEKILRIPIRKIMVIDDLANRFHDCDLLLDQNLGRTEKDYDGLIKANATALIGPKYALLRQEFVRWRDHSLARRLKPMLRSILVNMGGVDKDNQTEKVLEALKTCRLPTEAHITVVMGQNAPWVERVKAAAADMPAPTRVLSGVSNMAEIMASSDIAIGAAGSTSWERCCLGLPTVQLVLAENQKFIANSISMAGCAITVNIQDLSTKLPNLSFFRGDFSELKNMSFSASNVTDGRGAAVVANLMLRSR